MTLNTKSQFYKAKSLETHQWVEGYFFETKDNSYIAYAGQFDDDLFLSPQNIFIPIDKKTLCKHILDVSPELSLYENDVVKIGSDTAMATYSQSCSGYILSPITDFYFDSPMIAHNLDIIDCVIGNTIDTPELLGDYHRNSGKTM